MDGIDVKPNLDNRQKGLMDKLKKLGPRNIYKFSSTMTNLYSKLCKDCKIKIQTNVFDFCPDCEENTIEEVIILKRILDKINSK